MHKIALIEDNPDNRMLVVALLEDDFDIDEYQDGPAALAAMPNQPPDIILLDISLPGMDGTEVLKEIRRGPLSNIPIVALTAHAMTGDRERFIELGFDGYVSKPIVDEDDLFRVVRLLITQDES